MECDGVECDGVKCDTHWSVMVWRGEKSLWRGEGVAVDTPPPLLHLQPVQGLCIGVTLWDYIEREEEEDEKEEEEEEEE